MPLLIAPDYPLASDLPLATSGGAARRVGIINIMPRLEAYEPMLLRRLAASPLTIEPVFLRLESHGYTSSDHAHLDRYYRTFARSGDLDGLILTGAPVEEMPFDDVHYWAELTSILTTAQKKIRSTLGICWGGMALGALLDVPKRLFHQKLFGVFENEVRRERDPIVSRATAPSISCAHSRHSGCDDDALARAEETGRALILAGSPETGVTIFATPDHRFVAHLGHPEYEAERLVFEWERDRGLGRTDVPVPHGLDLAHPATTWRADSERFFANWLALLRP